MPHPLHHVPSQAASLCKPARFSRQHGPGSEVQGARITSASQAAQGMLPVLIPACCSRLPGCSTRTPQPSGPDRRPVRGQDLQDILKGAR